MSYKPPDIWSAHVYAAIGVIFYFLASLMWISIAGAIIWYVWWWVGGAWSTLIAIWPPWIVVPAYYAAAVVGGVALLTLVVCFIAYAMTQKRIDDGKFEAARAPCLFWGIVGLILGMVIAGVFFILAYTKVGELVLKYGPIAVPALLIPVAPPTPPCPTCGRQLTYDDRVRRWFCDVCKKYA